MDTHDPHSIKKEPSSTHAPPDIGPANQLYATHLRARVKHLRLFVASNTSTNLDSIKANLNSYIANRIQLKRSKIIKVQEKQLLELVSERKRALFNEKRRLDRARARQELAERKRILELEAADAEEMECSLSTGRKRAAAIAATQAITGASTVDLGVLPVDSDPVNTDDSELDSQAFSYTDQSKSTSSKLASGRSKSSVSKNPDAERQRIWRNLALTWIPKFARSVHANAVIKLNNMKRLAQLMERQALKIRRPAPRDVISSKCKRMAKEAVKFWAVNEKMEREAHKRVLAEALEQQRVAEVLREQQRQQRKLNFLLSQTELFAHFVVKKMDGSSNNNSAVSSPTTANVPHDKPSVHKVAIDSIDFDDDDACHQQARLYAKDMANQHATRAARLSSNITPPKMLVCQLKEYQIKGLEWLVSLYEQGINGILADEMGLGKTVQSISLLTWLAETQNLWGPYLIVTPVSTLHNWQQELQRFAPSFNIIPYWGDQKDRSMLRQFWSRRNQVYNSDSPAHVVVTSYQVAISDLKYFQGVEWEYIILDEAQAIKSSDSIRWNSLLQVRSRNRLLLTGTPVQNSMKELWALLHFIMPTLFDSHSEFNEWFSRDIESAAVNKKQMNAEQVKRLHTILQPFMLRRLKRDVQSELGEKIEIHVSCGLSKKQQFLYRMIKNKLSIRDILESMRNVGTTNARASLRANASKAKRAAAKSASVNGQFDIDDPLSKDGKQFDDVDDVDGGNSASLANVVMQLRKVCNHPELLERAETVSPLVVMPPMGAKVGPWVPIHDNDTITDRGISPFVVRYPRQLLGLVRDVSCYRNEHQHAIFRVALDSPYLLTGYTEHECEQIRWAINVLERAQLHAYITRMWQRSSQTYQKLEKDAVVQVMKQELRSKVTVLDVNPDWYPPSLDIYQPKVIAPPPLDWRTTRLAVGCSVTSAFHPGTWPGYDALESSSVPLISELHLTPTALQVPSPRDIIPILPLKGMPTFIRVPDMQSMIGSSGKLQALDQLLPRLKAEGHRCLMYFQMTRMMDVVEEYLNYRKYTYLRLDGSTELGERRDLVADWQMRDDLFLFILSTRAGGVGINLTAADTVIFVENDWNPTSDKQAMDRAHRLGQTRQVTVYRLFTRHTIEERILERARTKEEIQRAVISGTPGTEESNEIAAPSSKEMMSLLFGDEDDLEMRALLESEMSKVVDSAGPAKGASTPKRRPPKKSASTGAPVDGDSSHNTDTLAPPSKKRKRTKAANGGSNGTSRKRAHPDNGSDLTLGPVGSSTPSKKRHLASQAPTNNPSATADLLTSGLTNDAKADVHISGHALNVSSIAGEEDLRVSVIENGVHVNEDTSQNPGRNHR